MDSRVPMSALEQRCFDARITITELCAQAGVASACFTRYRRGERIRVRTIAKLENAMSHIESATK